MATGVKIKPASKASTKGLHPFLSRQRRSMKRRKNLRFRSEDNIIKWFDYVNASNKFWRWPTPRLHTYRCILLFLHLQRCLLLPALDCDYSITVMLIIHSLYGLEAIFISMLLPKHRCFTV